MVQVDIAIGIPINASAASASTRETHGIGGVRITGGDAIGVLKAIHALQSATAVITKLVGTRARLASGGTAAIIIVILVVGVAGITSTSTITKIAITSVFVYPINAGAVVAIHTIAVVNISSTIEATVAGGATASVGVHAINTGAAIFA